MKASEYIAKKRVAKQRHRARAFFTKLKTQGKGIHRPAPRQPFVRHEMTR